MALNVAKVTFAFKQDVYGWTENYFLNAPSANLQAEMTKAKALASKRVSCCGNETSIPYVKISRETIRGDVLVNALLNYRGTSTEPSDAPDTAVLVKRTADEPAVNAPLYMRGIWDSLITPGGAIDFASPWFSPYNAFKGELTGPSGWGFIARDPDNIETENVGLVTQNTDGTVHILTTGTPFAAFSAGDRIKVFISGVTGAAAINGSNIYKVVTTNSIDTVNRIPIFPYVSGGKMTLNVQKFYPITNTQVTRVVERKVGRPLYVSRGRSRNRVVA